VIHLHLISGGAGSWLAAKLDMRSHPDVEHRFSFTDVLYEDADCYRFLIEGLQNLLDRPLNWKVPSADEFPDYRVSDDTPIEEYAGNPDWRAFLGDIRERTLVAFPELSWLVEGRDPWEVFRDSRMLGNSRMDPCSRVLKREIRDRWIRENMDPATTVITVGIGPDEKHRFNDGEGGGFQPRRAAAGWTASAPLIGSFEGEVGPLYYLKKNGLAQPRLYSLGYGHNNCGGYCCKAGHAHYRNRMRVQPERFAYDKMMEQKLREYLGADVSMLTDRAGGDGKRPLTLAEFEQRILADPQVEFDWLPGDSGCGCAIDEVSP
jgi:hypothetical protein